MLHCSFFTHLHVVHSLIEGKCEAGISWNVFVIEADFYSVVKVSAILLYSINFVDSDTLHTVH